MFFILIIICIFCYFIYCKVKYLKAYKEFQSSLESVIDSGEYTSKVTEFNAELIEKVFSDGSKLLYVKDLNNDERKEIHSEEYFDSVEVGDKFHYKCEEIWTFSGEYVDSIEELTIIGND